MVVKMKKAFIYNSVGLALKFEPVNVSGSTVRWAVHILALGGLDWVFARTIEANVRTTRADLVKLVVG